MLQQNQFYSINPRMAWSWYQSLLRCLEDLNSTISLPPMKALALGLTESLILMKGNLSGLLNQAFQSLEKEFLPSGISRLLGWPVGTQATCITLKSREQYYKPFCHIWWIPRWQKSYGPHFTHQQAILWTFLSVNYNPRVVIWPIFLSYDSRAVN